MSFLHRAVPVACRCRSHVVTQLALSRQRTFATYLQQPAEVAAPSASVGLALALLGGCTLVAVADLASPVKLTFCDAREITTVLRVTGMGCQGCVGRVEGALKATGGVVSARVDFKHELAIVHGSVPPPELVAAIRSTGKEAALVSTVDDAGFTAMTSADLKAQLKKSGKRGLVLDIDETLSATNLSWFQQLEKLIGRPNSTETLEELAAKYGLAQNVPLWRDSPEAQAWMQRQRDSATAQDNLPLVPGAVLGVHDLLTITPVVGYCTVRPEAVNANTITWLRENGFPDLPVVAKPPSVPFEDGNKWKAAALQEMWPEVTGIVDDNPKVPAFAGPSYPGTIFLFSHAQCPPNCEHALPCLTWPDVVRIAKEKLGSA